MFKRIIVGLIALLGISVVSMLGTEANAACYKCCGGSRVCSVVEGDPEDGQISATVTVKNNACSGSTTCTVTDATVVDVIDNTPSAISNVCVVPEESTSISCTSFPCETMLTFFCPTTQFIWDWRVCISISGTGIDEDGCITITELCTLKQPETSGKYRCRLLD
jgi:hypothetical protein